MKSLEQLDRWIADKIKGWTNKVAGGQHPRALLEVRRDILEEVRDRIEPAGGGRSVFPFNSILIRIAASDEQEESALEGIFGSGETLESDIRGLIAEAGARIPQDFRVIVDIEENEGLAASGRPFRMAFSNQQTRQESERSAGRVRPKARIVVLQGITDASAYSIAADRFHIGRMKEVVGEKEGLRRRNDVAFAESETTVSREHASIRYDQESGRYRLYDTGSQRGTVVFRSGRKLDVPRGSAGVQLRSGDEIHLGNARLLFEVEEITA